MEVGTVSRDQRWGTKRLGLGNKGGTRDQGRGKGDQGWGQANKSFHVVEFNCCIIVCHSCRKCVHALRSSMWRGQIMRNVVYNEALLESHFHPISSTNDYISHCITVLYCLELLQFLCFMSTLCPFLQDFIYFSTLTRWDNGSINQWCHI